MFEPVQFRSEVEDLVRFIEETDPDKVIEATLAKLRSGTSTEALMTANALAVARSTEVPPQHHGGPLHPICGIRAVHKVAQRLPGDLSLIPVIQHTTLCNNHVHSPHMGPYLMPAIKPLQGSPGDVGSFHISDELLTEGLESAADNTVKNADSVIETKGAFYKSLRAMEAPAAEQYCLWLLERLTHGESLDLLLPLAIKRNNMDDHNFLYPVYTARALDCIGWEWASVLFRPAVRFQARRGSRIGVGSPLDYDWVEGLLEDHKLLEIDIPTQSSPGESDRIGELGMHLGASKSYFDTIEPMAEALAGGLSLQGAGEALSIGAAAAYLSTSYGNPMDSHLHTGTNGRRYLLSQDGVSLKNKLLGLLTGFTGPEVLLAERLMNWSCNIEPDAAASLPKRSPERLLDAITESIEGQPFIDWRAVGVARVVAPDEVKATVALARQYADLGYDPGAYFDRLAEIACRDDYTEMHSMKHFQAIVDEYYNTREAYRWLHMVSAAKSAAIIHVGREHSVYHQTKELLAAA
ncbi:MAG: hypothetical protein O7H39_18595 [Gammaproteobacteria bacterium]|nr:hypothetical protein [Gammaproteobacteria bacterium]